MTERQRRSLAKYVAEIGSVFGLRDWTLHFPEDPCADGAAAEVECVYGRRIAHVRFASDWVGLPPEEQRRVIVHELIHIHFAQMRQAILDGLKPLGPLAGEVAHDAIRLGEEYGTDNLADAIAANYPLWMP